jgi:hypothetical protein
VRIDPRHVGCRRCIHLGTRGVDGGVVTGITT